MKKNYRASTLVSTLTGEDALGESTVWIEYKGSIFNGRGLSTDVVEASAKTYLNAINKRLTVCGQPQIESAIGDE